MAWRGPRGCDEEDDDEHALHDLRRPDDVSVIIESSRSGTTDSTWSRADSRAVFLRRRSTSDPGRLELQPLQHAAGRGLGGVEDGLGPGPERGTLPHRQGTLTRLAHPHRHSLDKIVDFLKFLN